MTYVANAQEPTAAAALEKAAKYLCTSRCGLCPHVVEQFPCPVACTLDTLAWECWVRFFRAQAKDAQPQSNNA